jgi:hypothetical protein
MNRLAALAASLLSALALGAPEVKVDCPAGMHFVKDKGCVANVVARPSTSSIARTPVRRVPPCTSMGMPAQVAWSRSEKPLENVPPFFLPEGSGRSGGGGGASADFSCVFPSTQPVPVTKCMPAGQDVSMIATHLPPSRCVPPGHSTGRKVGDEQDVNVGETKSITGKHGVKEVDLKIQQGLWGTRYTLKVDGTECKLAK